MNTYRLHYPIFALDDYTDPYFVESLSSPHSFLVGRRNWEEEEEDLLNFSNSILKNVKRDRSPPKCRHDGTSPLPLGMDWSPPPLNWDGPNTVWPNDYRSGWSYCVTIPSWSILFETGGSQPVVFYRVQVGLQSPQGVTTTHEALRRFSDFLKLSSELKESFRHKKLPPAPQKSYLRMKNGLHVEERRRALEEWMFKILSDIDFSRSAAVACFVELEAADSFQQQSYVVPSAQTDCNSSDKLLTHGDGPALGGTSALFWNLDIDNTSEISGMESPLREYTVADLEVAPVKESFSESSNVSTLAENISEGKMQSREAQNEKIKDMVDELESNQKISEENLEQSSPSVKERSYIQSQWDLKELRAKCLDLQLRLKAEEVGRAEAEETKSRVMKQNEILVQELDSTRKQLQDVQKCHEKAELKSKTEIELLTEEIKALRSSQLEQQQVTLEKAEVEGMVG